MTRTTITPDHWLSPAAAASYARMRADGCPAGVTSAGRTRAEQQRLYDRWRAGLMPGTPSVARPGTSRHESGLALDIPEPARAWVRRNGHKYGWIRDLVRGEPWHFEYQSNKDTRRPSSSKGINVANLPVIRAGNTGINVGRMQGLLVGNGYSVGKSGVDRINGPATQDALRRFQTKHPHTGTNGEPDGICGPASWRQLLGL